jgi:hypothetical protein
LVFQIINISRNPKDAAMSMHHHKKNCTKQKGSLKKSLDDFLSGNLYAGLFAEHHLLYMELEKQGYPNILYLSFEEMKRDLDGSIRKVQKFLGKNYEEAQIEQLKEHLSFENMKSKILEISIFSRGI